MTRTSLMSIDRLDFAFENSTVKIVASRSHPEIKLAGLEIGPFEEGNEYEVCYWVGSELVRFGIARFHPEDQVDIGKLNKTQWTERVQAAGQMSKLLEGFYPRLRRCLTELREALANNPEKVREYERADHLAKDVVNSRLKKIVSLASSPAQTESGLRNLTEEERVLYERLFTIVNHWKTRILNHREES